MIEQTLLQESGAVVTTTMLKVGAKAYPLRNISAVEVSANRPSRSGGIAALLIGLMCASCAFAGEWTPQSGTLAMIGGLLFLAGCVSLAMIKTTYAVVISTSGGQVQALTSADFAVCKRISDAVMHGISQMR
jgi:hypothetical protein